MNASSQFEDALNSGAPLQKAFDAANVGGIVGLSEVVPIMSVLNRVNKATGGRIRNALINGLKGGTEEAIQESFVSVMDNLIASELVEYDASRGLFEGTGEAAQVGFTLGDLFATVGTLVGGKRARSLPQARGAEAAEVDTQADLPVADDTQAAPDIADSAPEVGETEPAPETPDVVS